jgi:hypothetical protein
MEQESLDVGPQETKRRTGDGIYKRFLNQDGTINTAAWLRATGSHEVIGTCKIDGGDLLASRPVGRDGDTANPDYPMECQQCHREYVAPRGKTLRWAGERGKRRPVKSATGDA